MELFKIEERRFKTNN